MQPRYVVEYGGEDTADMPGSRKYVFAASVGSQRAFTYTVSAGRAAMDDWKEDLKRAGIKEGHIYDYCRWRAVQLVEQDLLARDPGNSTETVDLTLPYEEVDLLLLLARSKPCNYRRSSGPDQFCIALAALKGAADIGPDGALRGRPTSLPTVSVMLVASGRRYLLSRRASCCGGRRRLPWFHQDGKQGAL